MACEIPRPTPQVLFDRQRDMFSTTVLNGSQVIPESNEWYVVSLNYAVAEEFYAFSEQQWKEKDPRYACCDNLLKLAAANGVFPFAATFAQGYIQINGEPGTALPDVIEVNIGDAKFLTESALPDVIPPEGLCIVRVRAEDAGSQLNGTVPATGTLATAIPGVESTVQVFGGMCGGEEAETCDQFRQRYLDRLQFAPKATATWIEQKLLEWPCATRVCVRSGSCCTPTGTGGCSCGSALNYYVFFDNSFDCGIAPQCVIDEINEWMFGPPDQAGYGLGQVEVGVCGKVFPMIAAPLNVIVSDYGCMTNAQKNEIRTRMQEFFRTLCPSSEISANQMGSVVGSVIGFEQPYAVEIEALNDGIVQIGVPGVADCGFELRCDYVACLANVTFIDTVPESGVC